MFESGSGLFLVDRSMGRLLLLASLCATSGWTEVCSSSEDVLAAASALLVDGLAAGSSWGTAGLLLEVFAAWFNWAS